MNKSQLVDATVARTGASKKDCEKIVNGFIDELKSALDAGERVQLVGFGTFETKERDAHAGRNPATGEKIQVEKSRRVVFTAGKTFKNVINK